MGRLPDFSAAQRVAADQTVRGVFCGGSTWSDRQGTRLDMARRWQAAVDVMGRVGSGQWVWWVFIVTVRASDGGGGGQMVAGCGSAQDEQICTQANLQNRSLILARGHFIRNSAHSRQSQCQFRRGLFVPCICIPKTCTHKYPTRSRK